MRVMMMLRADRNTETGVPPTAEHMAAMGQLIEDMAKAGVLVAADGLQPSARGKRMKFAGGRITSITDGPFAETKELIAGYWIINVKSKAEAIEWAKKIPFKQLPNAGREPEVELRQFFEIEDFPNAPADVVEQEKKHFGKK